MAIQLRRGAYANYDATKLQPGEVAVVQSGDPSTSDGKAIYIQTNTGTAGMKQLATTDQVSGLVDNTLSQTGKAADAKETGDAITATNENLADAFSTSTTYAVGDYCTYNGVLYRFTSAHSAGAWNASHVTAVTVGDAVSELSSAISDIQDEIDSFEGISDDVKVALLDVVSHIALWTDGQGQYYYDALHDALYSNEYPDLRTGEIKYGYYLNASGVVTASAPTDFYNEKYFPINPDNNYIWVRGFCGFVRKYNNAYTRNMFAYRICYYDSDKVFISRENSTPSFELGSIEPRYYELTPPSNAAFIRVSGSFIPVGNIYRSIPNDLYAVFIALADLNDETISENTDLMSKVSFYRNGVGVFHDVVYGRSDINAPSYNGGVANNNTVFIATYEKSVWFRDIFNCHDGHSMEESGTHKPNPDTTTRIHNFSSFLMRKGDVIRFNNVKAGVYAERISDGYVQHTTAWITDNSDFVIGGE